MALTMREKQSVTKEMACRYRLAKKGKKSAILDEFVVLTGYNRSYASFVLRHTNPKGVKKPPKIRQRKAHYDAEVKEALEFIWRLLDEPCGKRMAPYLPEIIPVLEKYREIAVNEETFAKLVKISAATIDRVLAPIKKKERLKPKTYTKPGSLLKTQIPIRTFAEWDEALPGFIEIDLVAHDGGNSCGEFCHTLDATDIATTWTETIAVKNRAAKWTYEAIVAMRERFPFPIYGIDSDNGGEFINKNLMRYCEVEEITFTRSRPYRKNDACYVEQKNYSVVRKAVGYLRYDSEDELLLLNEIYALLRLFTNFFQPSMKLERKTRIGAKVSKKYDDAQTPYKRVLGASSVSHADKARLKAIYVELNPVALRKSIVRLQNELLAKVALKMRQRPSINKDDFEYIYCEATNHTLK